MPNSTRLCAVVKSDAYGHGAREICAELNNFVDYFAVANNTEGITIKKQFPNAKVFVLGGFSTEKLASAIKLGVEISLEGVDEIPILSKYARKSQTKALIHIKVDTGMHRLGLDSIEKLYKFFDKLKKYENVVFIGLYSHLGSGDSYSKRNYDQILSFQKFVDICPVNTLKHLCNSTFYADNPCYDMVRVGIGLYGYGFPYVKPILNIRARIISIKKVKAGDFIGYGNKHKAKKDMTIATISMGYGDGLPRLWTKRGYVLIKGEMCRFVANICMNLSIIDISGLDVKINDYATILGQDGKSEITAKEIAKATKTIEYEILTNFKKIK